MIRKILLLFAALQSVLTKSILSKNNQFAQNQLFSIEQNSTQDKPRLRANGTVDLLCSLNNTINQTCTITNKTISLIGNFTYQTNYSLILVNSIVSCDKSSPYCSINIKLLSNNSLVLKNGSLISGKQIVIDAKQSLVTLLDTSVISVSGRSNMTFGTQPNSQGASFIGQGGFCNPTSSSFNSSFTYGNFNNIPSLTSLNTSFQQIGSMGRMNDGETLGGGRLVIVADSLILNGTGAQLQANAMPYANFTQNYSLNGGSGGYIYVSTSNLARNNTINNYTTIQANGGYGLWSAYGGAGGVIVFDGNFSLSTLQQSQVSATGGGVLNSTNVTLTQSGCGNGASGSIFFNNQSILILDNKALNTTQKTILTPSLSQNSSIPQQIASNIIIRSNVNVQVQILNGTQLSITNLTTIENVNIKINSLSPALTLSLGPLIQISNKTLIDLSSVQNCTINALNQSISLGSMNFGINLKIITGNLILSGQLNSLWNGTVNSSIYIESQSFQLLSYSQLISSYILVFSSGPITIGKSVTVQSNINNTCGSLNQSLFSCVPFNSLQNTVNQTNFLANYNLKYGAKQTNITSVLQQIQTQFTVYFVSFQSIFIDQGSKIQGPKLGFCAPDIGITQSIISTKGQGCFSDQGIGKGVVSSGCPGSGASNGGQGGFAAPYANNVSSNFCTKNLPQPYFNELEALYEGSGGASGLRDYRHGGNGGGIIWFSATNTVQLLSSQILSNGNSAIGMANGLYGSGGGAGGSVQIVTKYLIGDSLIDLSGGQGSTGGGGGGSGGRLATNFLQNFNSTIKGSLQWNGYVNLQGGIGGLTSLQNQVVINSNQTNSNTTQNSTQNQTNQNSSTSNQTIQVNSSNIIGTNITNNTNQTIQNISKPGNNSVNSTSNTTANSTTNATVNSNSTKPANSTTNTTTNSTKPANSTTNTTTNSTKPANSTTNATANSTKLATSFVNHFNLKSIISKGGDGSSGSATLQTCYGGFSGPFCSPCPIGTYKYDFGTGLCQNCQNKPQNSFYSQVAQSSSFCAYQCFDWLENVSDNPECLDSLSLNLQRFGNTKGFLILFFVILSVSTYIWLFITIHARCYLQKKGQRQNQIFSTFEKKSDAKGIKDEMIKPGMMHLREIEIWGHTYRMYMIGDGSISHPWKVPQDFPTNALNSQTQERFLSFIKNEQWTLNWSFIDQLSYLIIRIAFPYMAEWKHRQMRIKHFTSVSNALYETFDQDFWENRSSKTIRITCDNLNHQLGYIDFIDQKIKAQNNFDIKLPLTLLISGNGTLSTPFRINFEEDIVAKSIVFLNNNRMPKILPIYFENLNTLLNKLCFYKFDRQTMRDLNSIIDFIEQGNDAVFSQSNTKVTLYLFQNKFTFNENGQYKQRRRSLPLDSNLISSDPTFLKKIVKFVQIKMLKRKSEIKFGLVIQSTLSPQMENLSERLYKLLQVNAKSNQFSNQYKDQDIEKSLLDKPSFKKQNNLQPESLIQGQNFENEINVVDKSMRAFDISPESSEALLSAIIKEQRKCKNCWVRFKSVFYSLWLLSFKANGIPSGNLGNPIRSFMFALSLSIDILLTLLFTFHIASPVPSWNTFGIPFLLIMPGLVFIAPIWGIISIMKGSSENLKVYSTMNSSLLLFNYPLTMIAMLFEVIRQNTVNGIQIQQNQLMNSLRQQGFYFAVIIMLILNKILLSQFGSTVRTWLSNPGFARNQEKLQYAFQEYKSMSSIENVQKLTKKVVNYKIQQVQIQQVPIQDFQEQNQRTEITQNDNESYDNSMSDIINRQSKLGKNHNVKENVSTNRGFNNSDAQNSIFTKEIEVHRGFTLGQNPNSVVRDVEQDSGYRTVSTNAGNQQKQFSNMKQQKYHIQLTDVEDNYSKSSLMPNEENIDDYSGSDEDQSYGIVPTSKLRPSSVPQQKDQYYN